MSYEINYISNDGKKHISFAKIGQELISLTFIQDKVLEFEFRLLDFNYKFLEIKDSTADLQKGEPLYVFNYFLEYGFAGVTIENILNMFCDEPTLKNIILDDEFTMNVFLYDDRFEGWYGDRNDIAIDGVVINIDVDTHYWNVNSIYTSAIHGIDFKIPEDYFYGIIIDKLEIEDLIYNGAEDMHGSPSYDMFVENEIPYRIPSCCERLLPSLEKLDFLNTGKFINLLDEERKKYEGYVAKKLSFGENIDAELYVYPNGICKVMYEQDASKIIS